MNDICYYVKYIAEEEMHIYFSSIYTYVYEFKHSDRIHLGFFLDKLIIPSYLLPLGFVCLPNQHHVYTDFVYLLSEPLLNCWQAGPGLFSSEATEDGCGK